MQCNDERPYESEGALVCGGCGSDFVEVVSGEDLRSEALEAGVQDPRSAP